MFWHVVFCALIALAALQLFGSVWQLWRELSRPVAGEEGSRVGRYAMCVHVLPDGVGEVEGDSVDAVEGGGVGCGAPFC